jgi:hypothetical protein
MNRNVKAYKPDKSANALNGLVLISLVFFLLTLPHLVSGIIEKHELQGLVGFWLMAVGLAAAPFGFRLEVGDDYVESYFLGFSLGATRASDVEIVNYGNLFTGGLGFGKGLRYRARVNGRSKWYSIGERFWGKQAFSHARHVLESQISNR